VEVMKRFEARFGVLIYEGDGPTECSPVTSVNPIDGIRKAGSIGLPVGGVEMRIVDDSGDELPDGEVGEIVVRGANVMKGYWNMPEATAESFWGEWFRTGDLGHRDTDGYFYIVDRKKDMIIVNGMNVYPRQIEEVLYRHPAILECAVVSDPDPLHGEVPKAFYVIRPGMEVEDRELRRWCIEHLGRHQVPRRWQRLDQLPKNATGKIVKRELTRRGEVERGLRTED
jgi:long-chain acyl-CoA synthetase